MAKNKKKSNDNANNNGSVKKSGTARTLIGLLIVVLLIVLGVGSFRFAYSIANGSSVDDPPGRSVQVYIHDSMSPGDVAAMLQDKGLLDNTIEFVVHAKLKGYVPSRYTGSHTLNTSMNAEQQVNELMNLNGD
ncbi:MAG: hypothetical protein IK152_09435 [Lachnospiraceae bacterium]|nr:hypothetical protein [Lachnospiraceae bacterium]